MAGEGRGALSPFVIVVEFKIQPGKMAAWIAPPDRGINAQPVEYEYVRL